jgi:O-antigen/teichoic acid export membrane protein
MVTYVILSYSFLYSQILIAFNLQSAFMRFTLIGLFVNVVLNLLLVPAFGFMAAAAVTVVTQLIVLMLTVRRTPSQARALPTHRVAWGSLAAAAVMCVVVVMLRLVAAPVPVILVTAPATYIAAVVGVGAIRPSQVRDLLGRRPV